MRGIDRFLMVVLIGMLGWMNMGSTNRDISSLEKRVADLEKAVRGYEEYYLNGNSLDKRVGNIEEKISGYDSRGNLEDRVEHLEEKLGT